MKRKVLAAGGMGFLVGLLIIGVWGATAPAERTLYFREIQQLEVFPREKGPAGLALSKHFSLGMAEAPGGPSRYSATIADRLPEDFRWVSPDSPEQDLQARLWGGTEWPVYVEAGEEQVVGNGRRAVPRFDFIVEDVPCRPIDPDASGQRIYGVEFFYLGTLDHFPVDDWLRVRYEVAPPVLLREEENDVTLTLSTECGPTGRERLRDLTYLVWNLDAASGASVGVAPSGKGEQKMEDCGGHTGVQGRLEAPTGKATVRLKITPHVTGTLRLPRLVCVMAQVTGEFFPSAEVTSAEAGKVEREDPRWLVVHPRVLWEVNRGETPRPAEP
jgi:hypothetical protein